MLIFTVVCLPLLVPIVLVDAVIAIVVGMSLLFLIFVVNVFIFIAVSVHEMIILFAFEVVVTLPLIGTVAGVSVLVVVPDRHGSQR